ncbi:MAG: cytochrome P450 [Caldilineaceae bacterium]|nr:cytochrome P450 [Caldilineaceae bacterium]
MNEHAATLPTASGASGLTILRGLLRDRSLLTALALMREHVGPAFQITLPRFRPAVFVGPEANRQILVTDRRDLSWRYPTDPVVRLLRQGMLVVDGEEHDAYRRMMEPPLQRRNVVAHIPAFWRYTDLLTATWRDGEVRDMLVEMRRLALLILMGTTFQIDFAPHLEQLWRPILQLLEFISPGLWILWAGMPPWPRQRRAMAAMDGYLRRIIAARRAELRASSREPEAGDLLGRLLMAPGMDDELIRDQLLTMLIAGHDTSTALLAWVLFLAGVHGDVLAQLQAEADAVLGAAATPPTADQVNSLTYTEQVIKETLRLYPPIHVGNRRALVDLDICGYRVPERTRVMYSIYLSHRDGAYWQDPDTFCPARFGRESEEKVPPFTYVPFGGGPRNCIGAAFAQIEARVVLARLFQCFDFELLNAGEVRPHMGATLEPRPGVKMRVRRRRPCAG